jgi:hypothetical protein
MNTNNIMYFNRQNNNSVKCNDSSNSNLGVSDPLDISLLGSRKNRSKVIAQIKDYVLLMLGAPVISIELDQQQLDACVDLSLQILEDYAPREYFQLYVFLTSPGKSIYKMPPEVGYIRNISYKDVPTFNFSASDLGGAIPIEYFYPGGAYNSIQGGMIDPMQPIWGNMGEWVLYKQYEQMYSNVASNTGGWEWHGSYDQIKIYPIPMRSHSVIVHYIQKNKDWNRVTQAMQEGAIAFAKIMLGRIRSKIKNPPGPNGGVVIIRNAVKAPTSQGAKE